MLQSKCCSSGRWTAQSWVGQKAKRRHVGTLQRRGLDVASTHVPPVSEGLAHTGAEHDHRAEPGGAAGRQRAGIKKATVNTAAYEVCSTPPPAHMRSAPAQ